MSDSPVICIAGASGFVGRAVIPKFLERFPRSTIYALSRSEVRSEDSRVHWKPCDLFSLKSIEEALPQKADLALYLVHSMGPTAQLDQGTFADYDLILADNFARALKTKAVEHVIYLSGLIPERENLSLHLRSRLEVEKTFQAHQLPLTVLRAGLIIGNEGSSFQILLKLTKRLPVMICPKWTQSSTSPVDLDTVIATIASSALCRDHLGRTYDLSGCTPLTYIDMMRETARKMGKRRLFLTVPFFTPTLSRLWVSLITQSSKALVYPLIESLKHEMVARPDHTFQGISSTREYYDLLDQTSFRLQPARSIFRFRPQRKTVRSVQRLPLPKGRDAAWVKEEYLKWLPKYFSSLINVEVSDERITFWILSRRLVLMELEFSSDRSNNDRQLLYIRRGVLVSGQGRGRFEFRVVLDRQFVLAAIHDYRPTLPWFIYRFTQARIHLRVMRAFVEYLLKSKQSEDSKAA